MTNVKAKVGLKSENPATEHGALEKALDRLRDQKNYLAGAAAGLARLLPEKPVRDSLTLVKKPDHKSGH